MTSKKCGFIGIVGRPNVGKSTLLNHLLLKPISITSDKPQTTRHKIIGIKTEADTQMVFVDTPGMHIKAPKAMNRYMNKVATGALFDVDVVLWVVEALRFNDEDEAVLKKITQAEVPVILLVNKIDKVKDKTTLLPFLAKMQSLHTFHDILPISAEKNDNLDTLLKLISPLLPEHPFFYGVTQETDRTPRFRIAEIIREKLMRAVGQELPYELTVEVEQMKEEDGKVEIHAVIWVEREGQKKIIIGTKGEKLKAVATSARLDIKALLEKPVHLNVWVKVKESWSDDERALKSLGYDDLG